ncbi:alpha/beta hydrolase [Myroides injenensis]|uniref:alpha/beta hydrolase n=1 Tax=Myroides injenensis TaxID=1183151 RepID=UPI000287E66F|nr:alpha/beta hydrolase [Myroides injenensis]
MNLHLTFNKYITHQHPFENDYEGKVVTTLIESRSNKQEVTKTILYVHGFSDYFFQTHIMDYFTQHNINFFAVDLRKCGRSLLPHQHPNYCKSFREYFPDLDYAIEFIYKENPNTQLFLLGHSTGGLLVTYYAKFGLHRKKVDGVVLNSPFLDFNIPFYKKPFIGMMAKNKYQKDDFASIEGLSDIYGRSLHKDFEGEWEFNKDLKPILPFSAYCAWILAVLHVQSIIQEEPNMGDLPILLMHSDVSGNPNKTTSLTAMSDVVLNVKDMTRVGKKLSNNVKEVIINKGLHDLFLSKKEIRDKALKKVVDFIYSV